jgi:L-fuculose-phosphate aldolase
VDAIFGHLSGRLPGWERFWMKPAGIGLEEVHEEDLVLLDFEGRILAGQRPRHEEFPIHAEIMRTRPEVMAVVHTHPRHSVALSARGSELRPVGHEGSFFSPPGVPIFDQFTDLVRTREQGQAVAAALGECRAIFLRNHGIAVPGSSVAEACCAAIILERAAEVQLLAQPTADAPILYTPDDEARRKRAIWYPEQDPHLPERIRVLFDYYVRALPKP